MKRRFVACWRYAYIEDDATPSEYSRDALTLTVHAKEPETYDTGLVDEAGVPILSIDEAEPVGFHLNQWAQKRKR